MRNDITMVNFDEYIQQGEPQKRERGYAWQTAIGLPSGRWLEALGLSY